MAPERIQEMWQQFTKSFIGASATVILGVIVAFVGGFFQKIDKIAETQMAQSVQIKLLAVQIEERDKVTREAQARSVDKDSELSSRLEHFAEQHTIMLRKVDKVETLVEGRKR